MATGYGPRNARAGDGLRGEVNRRNRLIFNGDEKDYELWEAKFLGHLRLVKLKETILHEPAVDADPAEEQSKNEEAYAELIQCLDDKSLSLIMREAADDGRKALKLLREHYAGKGKPRIINLYTELTSLQKYASESITDYIIRVEAAITALRNAGETLSDGLLVAMVLKGLPESYKPFAIHVTQGKEDVTFIDFKAQLRTFEETEKYGNNSSADNIMKASVPIVTTRERESLICCGCNQRGHKANRCPNRMYKKNSRWCNYCRSSTHGEIECRRKARDNAKPVIDGNRIGDNRMIDDTGHSCAFKISENRMNHLKATNLMVDTGATSHIITDIDRFKRFDTTFQPERHVMELADGKRTSGVALKRGDAEVYLMDDEGRKVKALLQNALYIPTYPQDILSVEAATRYGASVEFRQSESVLVHKNGTRFIMEKHNRLYYLSTYKESNDSSYSCYDLKVWHEILGHCNYDDILKLPEVVEGMQIKGKVDKSNLNCNICTQGKFSQSRNREPDIRARKILELVHTDLAGPFEPVAKDGYRYIISFTDDYSGAVSVYFLKNKNDAVEATEKYIADVIPYGTIKRMRSDNGTEYTSREFQSLLRKKSIRHETSAPYSPHQNGTAERNWRTLVEMARCMLIESGLPKNLWTYAVMTAAQIRNRCFNNRLKETPYAVMTGRRPDFTKLKIFGSECFAYKQDRKKLDPKCTKGIFVGYDKNSPSYMIYYPDTGKILKHRLVKFVEKEVIEKQTQTEILEEEDDFCTERNVIPMEENPTTETTENGEDDRSVRYPTRDRKAPKYLDDYVLEKVHKDQASMNIDYCYRAYDVPQTFREAIESPQSQVWLNAMKDEMDSLRENDTFTLTTLPKDKNSVGGRWVYAIKSNTDGAETYKARFVAKGYSQVKGTDYMETFSPTANFTSLRILMQMAAQYDLILHQMDVKTAYLHAPIDFEIYMDQPEGFEIKNDTGERLVCKLKKSLYGLKQSGRNWNKVLHEYLCSKDFVQNPVDHCVYIKQSKDEQAILLIWVDDLIIAASNERLLKEVKSILAARFKMKDLGKLNYFLGINFEQANETVKMNQRKYILKILERAGMEDCKPRSTPCEQKLDFDDESEPADMRSYREIVGSLIYVTTCTRPDLSYIVSKLSQYFSQPSVQHMTTAKHVLRYLKGTVDFELCYKKSDKGLKLEAYSDASWASDNSDRRSMTGYCFSLSDTGALISWKSKKQPTIALSSCEAEYVALAATTQECLYLIQLLKEMDFKCQYEPVKIFEDNQSAIALARNPVCRQRCKHIDIKYHFLRSVLSEGKVIFEYCSTDKMVADVLTKPMTKSKLDNFVSYIFGV